MLTRKQSYRKDDRAMRPIYGCPGNFRDSLSTPIATFDENCNGLLFPSILRTVFENAYFVFFQISKKTLLFTFFEMTFQKNVKSHKKYQVC